MAKIRVDLQPEQFEAFVNEKGYRLSHSRAMLCACQDPQSRQYDPTCPLCDKGYQYWGVEEIRGYMSGVTAERQFSESGGFFLGTAQLTVPGNIRIGYRDRIVHLDSTISYNELMQRGAPTETDKIRFPALEVERVVQVVNKTNVFYKKGIDFTVSNRVITWASGKGPAEGGFYSISYVCHPSWLVVSYLHLMRDTMLQSSSIDTYSQLPVQVLCKLEFLVE